MAHGRGIMKPPGEQSPGAIRPGTASSVIVSRLVPVVLLCVNEMITRSVLKMRSWGL